MTARIDAIWDELAIFNDGKAPEARSFCLLIRQRERMTTLSCKVTSVEAITDTVYRVRLVPDAAFSFRAGQYLMVVMDERISVRSPWHQRRTSKDSLSCTLAPLS